MTLCHYEIHGLTVASEYPLDALELDVPPHVSTDYVLRSGEARPAAGRPNSVDIILAEVEFDGYGHWLVERPDGSWLLRYDGLLEFEISRQRGEISCHLAPGTPAGYAPVLVAGGVLAHLLAGERRLVLHASAVELGRRAIAVLGFSGAGKSTTAAHLCLAGAPLLTDDTLVVELDENGNDAVRVCRGTRSIRLRQAARERFDPEALEPLLEPELSADDRLLLRPPVVLHAKLELAAVLEIERSPEPGPLDLRRLAGSEAVQALLANPRTIGWVDPIRLRNHFRLAAALASRVPVLHVCLPDRPASEPLGELLLEAIAAHLQVSA